MRARELFSKNIKCCLSTHCAVNVRERKFIGEVQDASIDQFFSFFLELKISRFFIFFSKRPSVCFFCNQTKKNVKLKTCFSIKCLEGKKKTKPTSRWALSLIYLIFFFADDRFSSRKRDASLVRNLGQFEPRFELLNSSIIYSEPFSVITGCLCLWE